MGAGSSGGTCVSFPSGRWPRGVAGPRRTHTRSIRVTGGPKRLPHTVAPSLGSMYVPGRRARPVAGRRAGEAERIRVAIDQLERAELYVGAAVALDLADREQHRLLEGLLADIVAVPASILRPRPPE